MKIKFLSILLPIIFGIFGFVAGVSFLKLNEKEKTPAPTNTTSTTSEPQIESQSAEVNNAETYLIQKGDTLFTISLKFNTTMDELAKLNNIADFNQIKIGQLLKIPKTVSTSSKSTIQVDLAKMKEIQSLVDQGSQPWRLDPVEVVKADAPASYEFTALDTYTLKSKDIVKGEAVVAVRTFEIDLIQPITKGEKGIWAIVSIR